MKAAEYVTKYLEYVKDPELLRKVWKDTPHGELSDDPGFDAAIKVGLDMIYEGVDLCKLRKAKSDSAVEAVFREMNQKYMAFVAKLPPDEYRLSGTLKVLIIEQFPALAPMVKKWPGEVPKHYAQEHGLEART